MTDSYHSIGADHEFFVTMGRDKGFKIEENQDYGFGPIDVVWRIPIHTTVREIKCGFIIMRPIEQGSSDTEDNQFTLRKIEEAAFRGLRSGMDRTYLVAENEEQAKSISGKIEWLASHGSLIRLDAMSLGLSPNQKESSVIIPSQERVPDGEKIRKD